MTVFPVPAGAVLNSSGASLLEEIGLAAELGLAHVRLDVPWTACQPREGALVGGPIESLRAAATAAHDHGLAVWFRLLQVDVPTWFENEGGFADRRNAATWWPRWVELAAEGVGDLADGWVPFEAPYAMCNRLEPDDPRRHGEIVHHLVVGWRDAWRILHGRTPVATSLDVASEKPANDDPREIAEARRRDQLRWGLWLGGLRDGIVRIPGRAEVELADFAGACDVLGLAMRADIETGLYRAHDQGPECPLALTYRPKGATPAERSEQLEAMAREVAIVAADIGIATDIGASVGVGVRHVTITPFTSFPGHPG